MTAQDPLAGQLVDDRYRLDHRIGSGGMSVVYLAHPVEGGGDIAIKFLRGAFANLPDFVDRFEQEAQACGRFDHPNCLKVMGHGVAFGSPYLVMEYIKGSTLSQLLIGGPLSPQIGIEIARQILAGLHHAHGRGVVHRDLKPGNIMLSRSPQQGQRIKVMDFGTAQLLTSDQEAIRHGGASIGTPWYMAPEQAAGQPTDQRTDLYAVGVILFEMLTGERPYTALDPSRVLQMHLSSPIPSARALKPEVGISPELEAVIVRAMQKQPDDRFPSAEAFGAALMQTPEVQPKRPFTGSRPSPRSPSPGEEPMTTEEFMLPGDPVPNGGTIARLLQQERKKLALLFGLTALTVLGFVLLLVALTCDGLI